MSKLELNLPPVISFYICHHCANKDSSTTTKKESRFQLITKDDIVCFFEWHTDGLTENSKVLDKEDEEYNRILCREPDWGKLRCTERHKKQTVLLIHRIIRSGLSQFLLKKQLIIKFACLRPMICMWTTYSQVPRVPMSAGLDIRKWTYSDSRLLSRQTGNLKKNCN